MCGFILPLVFPLLFDLFEVIFYHLHHSLLPVLHSQQPKGNTEKGKLNDQCKKKIRQSGNADGPFSGMLQSTVPAVFSLSGMWFLQNATSSSLRLWVFVIYSFFTQPKTLSFNSFVKVPCCLLFLNFPLLLSRNQDCLLAYIARMSFLKDPCIDSGVWKNALLLFRHLVHSPKGIFFVPRCIGKPKGAHFYQTKAKHLHCMCQTEHLVHVTNLT